MEKYSLLELTILEERIGARIPPKPGPVSDHSLRSDDPTYIAQQEYDMEQNDVWRDKYKKEQNALNKIKVEIGRRLDEVIESE